jgi:hypothetical protein
MEAILLLALAPLFPPLLRWVFSIALRNPAWDHPWFIPLDILLMAVYPQVFLQMASGVNSYGCCGDDAALFHSQYILGLQVILGLAAVGFLVLCHVRIPLPPLLEFLLLGCVGLGIGLTALIAVHDQGMVLGGMVPWIMNMLWVLWKRSCVLATAFEGREMRIPWLHRCLRSSSAVGRLGQLMLLLTGGVTVLALVAGILHLLGESPDALARAFTQTYKHTFSQLTYDCSQVDCRGMYLCTIGAQGHTLVVGSTRLGLRNGQVIVCSRQLLVSNAFEASLARCLPVLQRWGRMVYDRLGEHLDPNGMLSRHRLLCDAVHLAMKPAEWGFLAWLYLVESCPQRLIASQYLSNDGALHGT